MMDKKKKLAQIADAMSVVEKLVREYNENIEAEYMDSSNVELERPAVIAMVSLDKTEGAGIEIHLHGALKGLDVELMENEIRDYDNYSVHDYECRFRGANLTATRFDWHLQKEETA